MKSFLSFILMFGILTAFSSCDKDDQVPEKPGNENPDAPIVKPSDAILQMGGKVINRVNIFPIEYNDIFLSRIEVTKPYYFVIETDFPQGTIDINGNIEKLEFYDNGLIKEINRDYTVFWGGNTDYQEHIISKTNFTYDESGYLIQQIVRQEINESQYGVTNDSPDLRIYTNTCSWENNNLIKVDEEIKYIREYSDTPYKIDNHQHIIEYSALKNKYKQFPISLTKSLYMWEQWKYLAIIGLMGKGPENLPTKISSPSLAKNFINVSYELYNDGGIFKEMIDNDTPSTQNTYSYYRGQKGFK